MQPVINAVTFNRDHLERTAVTAFAALRGIKEADAFWEKFNKMEFGGDPSWDADQMWGTDLQRTADADGQLDHAEIENVHGALFSLPEVFSVIALYHPDVVADLASLTTAGIERRRIAEFLLGQDWEGMGAQGITTETAILRMCSFLREIAYQADLDYKDYVRRTIRTDEMLITLFSDECRASADALVAVMRGEYVGDSAPRCYPQHVS